MSIFFSEFALKQYEIIEESTPDKKVPTGTSETDLLFTDLKIKFLVTCLASLKDIF